MVFGELEIGDRFASGNNPNNRLYQKVSGSRAIDLSEGPDNKGRYIRDSFRPQDVVCLRNDVPAVTDYSPEKIQPEESHF